MKKLFLYYLMSMLAFGSFSQTVVNLVRQSDGVVVGTATLNDNFCTSPDTVSTDTIPPTTSGNALYFDGLTNQYISCNYDFTGEFDLFVVTQSVVDVGGWIGLLGAGTVSNRHLLSSSNQRYWANINSGTLQKREGLTYDCGLELKTRIYRDASNDIYIQFNDQTPVYCFSSTNNYTFTQICRAYDKAFKGYLIQYNINGELFDLSEQSGSTLTGSNGTVHNIQSNVDVSEMWQPLPNQTITAQVYNEGVGGNNVVNLLNRTADVSQHNPDQILIWPGTNDALNATGNKILPVADFQDSLELLVQTLKIENPGVSIAIINTIPCVDSILKSNHDYLSYYGDETTFDLNVDVIPLFNNAILSIGTSENVPVLNAFNEVNQNPGWFYDGTHIDADGYFSIAQLAQPICVGKQRIVCFGDSHTAGTNVSGGFDYPTRLEQLLNQ